MEIINLLNKKDFSLNDFNSLNWNAIPFTTTYKKRDISDFNSIDELEQFLTNNSPNITKDVSGIYAYYNKGVGIFKIEIGNPIVYSILNDYKRIVNILTYEETIQSTQMKYFQEERNEFLWIEINNSVLNSNYDAIKNLVETMRLMTHL